MDSQRNYWERKIVEWTASGYHKDNKKISFIERLAYPFRRADKRFETGIQLISPLAKNKIILDLGFGLGDFSFALLKHQPKKAIGIDIAASAVNLAKGIARKSGLTKSVDFRKGDVRKMNRLPNFDIAVGLGFIDYLNQPELSHLFKIIGDRLYLFSYFEKKFSWLNILHSIYIRLQNCPGAYKFTRSKMKEIIPARTKPWLIAKNGLVFITNIDSFRDLDWRSRL